MNPPIDFADPEMHELWNTATQCPHLPVADFPEFAKKRLDPASVPLAQIAMVDFQRAAVYWHRSGELHLRCAAIELVLVNELERARFEPRAVLALVDIAQIPQVLEIISSPGRRVNHEAAVIRPTKKH